MYRHKLDCAAVTKSSHKEGKNKNIKAAIFALRLEIKANFNTPFQEFLYNNLRNDPVAELIRNDPLIMYVGEYCFNKYIKVYEKFSVGVQKIWSYQENFICHFD